MPHLAPPKRIAGSARIPLLPSSIALSLGIMLLVFGTGISAATAAGWINPDPRYPPWVLFGVSGFFLLGGGWVAGRAAAQIRWNRRAQDFPEAWQRDYPWPEHAVLDDSNRALVYQIAGLSIFGMLLLVLHALYLSRPIHWKEFLEDGRWVPAVVLGLFDLVFILGLGHLLYRLAQRLRFGRLRLVFEQGLPFFLGGKLRGRLEGHPKLARATRAEAVLRCVDEFYVNDGSSRSKQHVMQAVYEEPQPLSFDLAGTADIRFDLPADGLETCLAGLPATRYWELVVRVAFPGVDYEGVFLVPVYRPNAEG